MLGLCWEDVNKEGYGTYIVRMDGRQHVSRVHRLMYHRYKGYLGNDQVVCHKCDNPSCVNHYHLFAGTQQDNMRDMRQKGRGNSAKKKPVERKEHEQSASCGA